MLTLLLLSGCDRSPYDLTVRILDQDGNAIPGATVILSERGDVRATDDDGSVTWTDLEDQVATLIIAAQGYLSRSVEVTLERGRNEQVIALEPDLRVPNPSDP
jgi:hypothetical protein